MTTDPSCVFCAIVAGTSPVSVVYEDDVVLAFLGILPVNEGHALVVPRAHAVGLGDLPSDTGRALFAAAQRLAAALLSSVIPCDGVNLFLADGVSAGQEVFHTRLHVIPRLAGDGFQPFVDYGPPPSRDELDFVAETLRRSIPG